MDMLATTRLSTKGQVVIPEMIRKQLGLEVGAQFVVFGQGDTVIFKTLAPPSRRGLSAMLKKAQAEARRAGMKRADVSRAIKEVRASR